MKGSKINMGRKKKNQHQALIFYSGGNAYGILE